MSKRSAVIVVVVIVVAIVIAVLNGDRIYDALIRMHGGTPHH